MFDTKKFICELEAQPPLYDVKSKEYSSRETKARCWLKVAEAMYEDRGETDVKTEDKRVIGGGGCCEARRPRSMLGRLRTLDDQFRDLSEFCERMAFTKEELEVVWSPFELYGGKTETRGRWRALGTAALLLILLGSGAGLLSQVQPVAEHSVAIGRIGLIKLLPFWDWRHLYNEHCLITNPLFDERVITSKDCWTCESVDAIDVLTDTNYRHVAENYLSRGAPFIVTDAMETWHVMNQPLLIGNITEVYWLVIFALAEWANNKRNCDLSAVKAMRKFYEKPYFLSTTASPAHSNWVLLSSEYNVNHFKEVEVEGGEVAMYMQFRGDAEVRLTPLSVCDQLCSPLRVSVNQGEILVVKTDLWRVEHRPGGEATSIAILTQAASD